MSDRTGLNGAIETILVVDDNLAKRYLVTRWLVQSGYPVIEAATGTEALRMLRQRPALVIMDVRLPDMSGFEVVRRMKSDPRTAPIPVLHLSAHVTSPEDRVHGLEGGADGYLTHPIEPDELRATVRALLRVRRAEAALRASEERFRLVARATNDVVWDWDLLSGSVEWNSAVHPVFGYAPERVGATTEWWYDHIHPQDRDRVTAGQLAVIGSRAETWSDEYRFRRADGGYATVFDRGYVLHGEQGEPVRMIGSMLDVTQRKRAEERQHLLVDAGAALASSLDYRTTLRTVARLAVPRLADFCAVYLTDDSGAVRLCELAAADPGIEHALADLDRRFPVRPDSRSVVARVLRTGDPEFYVDTPDALLQTTAGDAAHLEALRALRLSGFMVVPMTARGRTLGALMLGLEQSERRYSADDLVLARDLGARAALAMDNARLYDQAVLANSAKADFLAVMSHELRTPLNAVVGYTDLMLMGIPRPLEGPTLAYVQRVKESARHLLELIEQILTFSRVEAGREDVVAEEVDLARLAAETARIVEPLARLKGLRFELDHALPATTVRTDASKVRQILINLLSNAIKFTDHGMVRLRIERGDAGIVCRVEDTGIGIANENLDRIFDPFWQVEQRKTRTAGGTGLGLTVSRRLAQLLGGDLVVASVPGKGSAFVFQMPAEPKGADESGWRRGSRDASGDAPGGAAAQARGPRASQPLSSQ